MRLYRYDYLLDNNSSLLRRNVLRVTWRSIWLDTRFSLLLRSVRKEHRSNYWLDNGVLFRLCVHFTPGATFPFLTTAGFILTLLDVLGISKERR